MNASMPKDLASLAAEIHADNIHAGWWTQDQETGRTLARNVGELLCLVHSEISEADEGVRGGLMDDKLPHRPMVEVELADTAIRVLDMLGFYGDSIDSTYAEIEEVPDTFYGKDWRDWFSLMHCLTSNAMEGFRKGDATTGRERLVDLLDVIIFAAITFDLDLTGAIAEKRSFNASREDHKLETRQAAGGKSF